MSTIDRPLPRPTDITQPYWDAAMVGKLVIQECQDCGARQFYPRNICIKCASDRLGWLTCSGEGSIYTFTINHRAPHPYFKGLVPYVVAMVELDEGVRLMGNVRGEDALQAKIGSRVKVVFEDGRDEVVLPGFELRK